MKFNCLENPCWGGQDYVSPYSKVVEIMPEGVLCASGEGTFGVNDWLPEEDTLDW